jgi:hypothetical protein
MRSVLAGRFTGLSVGLSQMSYVVKGACAQWIGNWPPKNENERMNEYSIVRRPAAE